LAPFKSGFLFCKKIFLKDLKVIAFTHKNFDLKEIGNLIIPEQDHDILLSKIKTNLGLHEVLYLGTCNRVEFVFTGSFDLNELFVHKLLDEMGVTSHISDVASYVERAQLFEDLEALNHLLKVSCSVESLVVGEKEILAQLRLAYQRSSNLGLTSDSLRIIMNRVVKTAKEVYTKTKISEKPISVVSLAYRKLKSFKISYDARFILIGAGETNNLLAKYLSKHGFKNLSIYNRTLEKAALLALELNGNAFQLEELKTRKEGFDVLITCTSAIDPIITSELYENLLAGETDKKIILDLAVPFDTHPDVIKNFLVNYISITELKGIAENNLKDRYNELEHAEKIIQQNIEEFKPILRQRRVELAMKVIPEKIKEIRNQAVENIFASEIEQLDPNSRLVLEKVLNYFEKKYISVPMKMAKEILVKEAV